MHCKEEVTSIMEEEAGTLCRGDLNPNLLNIRYAIRGPIVQRADQIQREIDQGVKKPFSRVIRANIGDNQALGQPPLTFIRQVLALVSYPPLLDSPDFSDDIKSRAREILHDCTKGSVGAYTDSAGLPCVRQRVAQYLTRRDGGVPARAEDIFLGAGASDLIRSVLQLVVCDDEQGKKPAVLVPWPQYPVFSGTLAELGVAAPPYELQEGGDEPWALLGAELERAWAQADREYCVRALVVINPGNPTGQVLSRARMEEVVRFARRRRLLLLADEVYQQNVVSKPFISFKKVVYEMGPEYSSVALASFLTASKGWAAECGLRSGALELCVPARPEAARPDAARPDAVRPDAARPDAAALLLTARSLHHCPSVLSQTVMYCVVHPPQPGEASYEQFSREVSAIRDLLVARSSQAHRLLNDIPGYSCSQIDGGMFAFPRLELPERALAAADAANLAPDHYYCLQLLEETGICVVPGSGFGQARGAWHFRSTILHDEADFLAIMDGITRFHTQFLNTHS